MTRYLHRHHGLVIGSEIPLSCAAASEGDAVDVDVVLDVTPSEREPTFALELDWRAVHAGWAWRATDAGGSWLRMRYARDDDWAEFVVDPAGRRVWLSLGDGVAIADAGELLLGPVFSCLLSHRGLTCLHASVVRIDGRVIAFSGPKGAGKSTIAVALARRGAEFVSDDVAVLAEVDGRPAVTPGRPSARMRADAAGAVSARFDELAPIWLADDGADGKRVVDLALSGPIGSDTALRLGALVLLDPLGAADAQPSLHRARPAEVLPRLMASRHMATTLDDAVHGRDLAFLAQALAQVPAYRLVRPDALSALDRASEKILRDVVGLAV